MYRFKSIKYISTTIFITSLLVVVAYFTLFIKININNNKSIFQLSDGLYLSLIILIKGPMLLISGILYVFIIDLISGSFIHIPISIIIRILMFLTTYFFHKILTIYLANLISSLFIFIYVFYSYFLYGYSRALLSLFNCSLKFIICYFISILFSLSFLKINKISNYKIWYDKDFDKYK